MGELGPRALHRVPHPGRHGLDERHLLAGPAPRLRGVDVEQRQQPAGAHERHRHEGARAHRFPGAGVVEVFARDIAAPHGFAAALPLHRGGPEAFEVEQPVEGRQPRGMVGDEQDGAVVGLHLAEADPVGPEVAAERPDGRRHDGGGVRRAAERVLEVQAELLAAVAEHLGGALAPLVEHAPHPALAVDQRREAVVPVGFLRHAVPRHGQHLVEGREALARLHHGGELGGDDVPDVGPHLAAGPAEAPGVALGRDLRPALVVEQHEVGAPVDGGGEGRAQADAQGRAQHLGPALGGPERSLGPGVGADQRTHRAPARHEGARVPARSAHDPAPRALPAGVAPPRRPHNPRP